MNREELEKRVAEEFLEYRQELCNTEFAVPPFNDQPVDPELHIKKARTIIPLIEQEVREEIWGEVNNLLRISMNEMGFVEISNHIDFGDWQSLKGGQHE